MTLQLNEKHNKKYLTAIAGEPLINMEQDALDLLGVCGEHKTNRLILFADNLSPGFFDLKTRLAGEVFQKFINYHMKCAIVLPNNLITGRFREMVIETNRGRNIRFFQKLSEAENWITEN